MERYDIVCIQNLAPRNGDKMTQRETSFKTPTPANTHSSSRKAQRQNRHSRPAPTNFNRCFRGNISLIPIPFWDTTAAKMIISFVMFRLWFTFAAS